MKVVIAGSRDIVSLAIIALAVEHSGWLPEITEVVSGCARGVDRLGEFWAVQHGIQIKQFPANWKDHGQAAGRYRNMQMAEYADALIAVWDGESRGTGNMIEEMRCLGKPAFVKQVCGMCRGSNKIPVINNAIMTGDANPCSNCDGGWVSE